jgi:hypothetical protein
LREKMAETWYEIVPAHTPLTQGDLIFRCPVVGWEAGTLEFTEENLSEVLKSATLATAADVVIMTQACDLEHGKVGNVILCPHVPLGEHRSQWEDDMRTNAQNPTEKAWRAHCDDICNGFLWNLMMLNRCETEQLSVDIRIVYFDEVFTVPVSFLESLNKKRGIMRVRLLPPYREHLSQAFARFFMRVGLPVPVEKVWATE